LVDPKKGHFLAFGWGKTAENQLFLRCYKPFNLFPSKLYSLQIPTLPPEKKKPANS
jgi:hypothetical protein